MSKSAPRHEMTFHLLLPNAAYEKRGAEKVQAMKSAYAKNRQTALATARAVDKHAAASALQGNEFCVTATAQGLKAVMNLSFLTMTRVNS